MATYGVAVIGGGIVGLATALALQRTRGPVVVLEAEDRLAAHQSGRNSGVIHSGVYYKPGSLKARLCRRGHRAMYEFCAERGVRTERCGKLIVACDAREAERLVELERRAAANGLTDVRRCGPAELREHEPEVAGVAGLWLADTGIVDYAEVSAAMARLIGVRGGEVRLGCRVLGACREGAFHLETTGGEIRTRNVVNCAGVQSDRVAAMFGTRPGLRIIPFRGEYYELAPTRRGLVRNLIYPVPDPAFPFLGVHFTRGVHGGVEAGPNAVLVLDRHGYDGAAGAWPDAWEVLSFPGFWRMARRHWRSGLAECWRSASKAAFVRSLQRLVPAVREEDLVPARAGIRAQAVEPDGSLVDDFRFMRAPGVLHVLNAPSPAATASLCIGEEIAQAATGCFSP